MHINCWIRAEVLQPHTQIPVLHPPLLSLCLLFFFSSSNIYSELKLKTNMSISIIQQAFVSPLHLLIYVVVGEGHSFPFARPALLIFTCSLSSFFKRLYKLSCYGLDDVWIYCSAVAGSYELDAFQTQNL